MSNGMAEVNAALIQRLSDIVGPGGALTEPADVEPHVVEWRDLYRGRTPLVLRPGSTEEVSRILALCNETRTPVVPQGGNTSLVGGSIPFDGNDEVVLSLSRMNRVLEIDPLNDTMLVEAGTVLANIQQAADDADRLFPLRIGSEGSCQIGGNLSTNAGGVAVLRYGNARDLVLGLEVVLADGRVWNGLRGLRKDNTGYDLKQLFVGAEGTLGVITRAVLKLYPKPKAQRTAFVAVPGVRPALDLFSLARGIAGDRLTAFELMPRIALDMVRKNVPGVTDPLQGRHPWYVLLELSAARESDMGTMAEDLLAEAMEKGLVVDATIAASERQSKALWHIREEISGAQKPEGGSIKHDISVPVSKMAEFIERADAAVAALIPGVRSVAFGHVGDGNVHYNPLQPAGADKAAFLARWQEVNDLVHGIAHDLGGSISAEHGLGRMKREEILRYKSDVEMAMMRSLKATLDPNGILNPGKTI
ncbi:FAD-binding oxidoreductase [Oceanibacterium hippocampi]|uniref:Putative FAD-linked oxidoreductase n=1 Tax=Oceanibacterium hippocampi TaxID=745714 RepID=A0A1Y5S9S1_9PROT|nr:FAD-binding oxidoreductase [Oceanibacterium hippocampi]SLN35766.1 putative FAD-linked oxidoreductase [Oceanibacterium hippocampi]